jgi:hypothetical protein
MTDNLEHLPIYDPARVFAALVATFNAAPEDQKTICKGCGCDMLKGGPFHSCCSAICFRDSYC